MKENNIVKKQGNTPIMVLLKLSPAIFYFLIRIIDVGTLNPFKAIVLGVLSGVLMLMIEDWGLIAFEIFLFVAPKGKTKIGFGLGVIAVSIVSAIWQYMLCSFVFSFDGSWRPTLIAILTMNAVYAIVTLVIMFTPDTNDKIVQNTTYVL